MTFDRIILSLGLTFLFFQSSLAQSGFSAGVSSGYLFSYRTLRTDGSALANSIKKIRDDRESLLLGFTFSADGMYEFKNKLTLSTALSFSNIGYQIQDWDLYYGDAYPPGSLSKRYESINIRYRLSRLSIPLMAGYTWRWGEKTKQALLFRLGVSNNFTLLTRTIAILTETDGSYERESEDAPSGYNAYNLSGCAAIGYYFCFGSNRLGLNVLGDYAITPNTRRDLGVKDYYYFGGFNLSYLYTFQ